MRTSMKTKGMIILLLLMMIVGLSAWSSIVFAQNKNILIAGDEEKKGGYLVEITRVAFQRVGYTPEFIFVPWARALNQSIKGESAVLLAAYYTKERAEKLVYTEPIGTTRVFLLKRKNQNITYQTMNDLRPYLIGHIRGSKVSQEFDEAEKTILRLQYVTSAEQNIRKLLAGRIDLVVEKEERLLELLKTEFKEDAERLEFLQPPLHVNNFYNCVSKTLPRHQQIVDDFNRGLRMIREDGTLATILNKYGIVSEER